MLYLFYIFFRLLLLKCYLALYMWLASKKYFIQCSWKSILFYQTLTQMDAKNILQISQNCKNCIKNHSLISKYEKLTQLYEKKQLKLSLNGSSTLSNMKVLSNTLDTPSPQPACIKIVQVLSKLIRNKYACFYRLPQHKSAKKFILLNLANRMERFSKIRGFLALKMNNQKQGASTESSVGSEFEQQLGQQFRNIPADNENSVSRTLYFSEELKPEDAIKQIVSAFNQINKDATPSINAEKQLLRKIYILEIQNKKLRVQNISLKQTIEELNRRLEKENGKKIDNLREIQEQRREREQEIRHLKQSLKAYESIHNVEQKVLENDIAALRRDLDEFSKLNKMLNNDLDKIKAQLSGSTKKLKMQQQKSEALEQKVNKLSEVNYTLSLKAQITQKLEKQYKIMVAKMGSKMKRLAIYQKQLEENIKNCSTVSSYQSSSVQQELKSELILMYLANLEDPTYNLKSQHLFDEDEKNMLQTHKNEWMINRNKIATQVKLNENKAMQVLEISQIPDRKDCDNSDWDCLDHTRQNLPQIKDKHGPTMRMIELQIQNKKQINKVAELKQKFLHIRDILFKLLKSFELSHDIKAESKDILRVLFDLFEYSEEERDRIFLKKKRLFGLI